MSDLTFEAQSIFLQSCQLQRGDRKPGTGTLFSNVGYAVSRADYTDGSDLVRVATRLEVGIFASDDGEESAVQSNMIGHLHSEHVVTFKAPREIVDADANDGRLDPAVDAAHALLFPYHRATVEELSGKLGIVPFRLPPRWEEVEASLSEAALASEQAAE